MNYLLCLSLWLLLLTSCSPSLTKGFHREGKQLVGKEQLPPMIEAPQLSRYGMTIDFRDKHFSGLLLIKQSADKSYRIVLSTHFGLSIFDFELTPDTFVVHHCAEPLRKKKLLSLLHSDFTVLLGLNLKEENEAIRYTNRKENDKQLFRLKKKPAKGYYLTGSSTPGIQQIKTGKGLGKALFQSTPSQNNIQISHPVIKLTMKLELL